MNGTLALWYEPKAHATENRVKLELHVNLWRDLPSSVNFLDIGMLLSDVESMSRFSVYLPARIHRQQLQDLFKTLDATTANAVFNDAVSFAERSDFRQVIRRSSGSISVFEICDDDFELRYDDDPVFELGTYIDFRDQLVRRMQANSAHPCYVRFRIHLEGDTASTFSSDDVAPDRFFATSAGRLEVTEFRVNERRCYPESLKTKVNWGEFHISRIHYFLIRTFDHHLISQHSQYVKARRLEQQLWKGYLRSAYPDEADFLNARLSNRLVIYHWKERDPDGNGVPDFIAFASFRSASYNLAYYALGIIMLGAVGSLLASVLSKAVAEQWEQRDRSLIETLRKAVMGYPESALLWSIAAIVFAIASLPALRRLSTWSRRSIRDLWRKSPGPTFIRRARDRLGLRKRIERE